MAEIISCTGCDNVIFPGESIGVVGRGEITNTEGKNPVVRALDEAQVLCESCAAYALAALNERQCCRDCDTECSVSPVDEKYLDWGMSRSEYVVACATAKFWGHVEDVQLGVSHTRAACRVADVILEAAR